MRIVQRVVFVLAALALSVRADAGVRVVVRPGGWTDIVQTVTGFQVVRATSSLAVTELTDGTLRWQTPIPEPILYLRAAADSAGTVHAIAQGNNSGLAYVISATGVTSLGTSFGQNATAIWWAPARGFVYFVQTSPSTYAVFDSAGCAPCAMTMPATSQGFRDIQPDGTVRRGDDYFSAVFSGKRLWEFVQRGAVTIGQCDPAAICAVVDGQVFTVLRGDAFEPHLALDGATFAVVARTGAGAALAIVEPPYPAPDTLPSSPSPLPPSLPPTPVIDPVPVPQAVPDASGVFRSAVQQHPDLLAQLTALADRGNATGWPADIQAQHSALRATLLRYGAYVVWQGDHNWGLLRKDGGSLGTRSDGVKHATDILVYRPTMALVDVFDDYNPSWGPLDMSLAFNQRTPDFWIQPIPEGPTVPTVPPPVIQPPPPPAGGVTRAELDAAIQAATAQLHTQVTGELASALRDVDARITASQNAVDDAHLKALIAEAFTRASVDGQTDRDRLGLRHDVHLKITVR